MVTTLRPAVNQSTATSSTVQTAATRTTSRPRSTGPGAAAATATPGPATIGTARRFTGTHGTDLGSLTHLLIGHHVRQVRRDAVEESPAPAASSAGSGCQTVGDVLLNHMFAAAYDLIDANPNASRVLATEAASLAYRYLTDFLPDPTWGLLGVEYDTGDGIVDLAWVHDSGVVFYDEVKTSRVTNAQTMPASWVAQARRYSAAGVERHRYRFIGTRLIPVMASHLGRLVLTDGAPMLLAPTGPSPVQRSGQPVQPTSTSTVETNTSSPDTATTGRVLHLVRNTGKDGAR